MKYTATTNTPGRLPDSDGDVPTFDTIPEAWWHLYHERCQAEREAPCDLCGDTLKHGVFGDCDDDTDTGRELAAMAKADPPAIGTVYGPTPGYSVTGVGHDLGLAYNVEVLEPMFEEGTPEFEAAHGEEMLDDEDDMDPLFTGEHH